MPVGRSVAAQRSRLRRAALGEASLGFTRKNLRGTGGGRTDGHGRARTDTTDTADTTDTTNTPDPPEQNQSTKRPNARGSAERATSTRHQRRRAKQQRSDATEAAAPHSSATPEAPGPDVRPQARPEHARVHGTPSSSSSRRKKRPRPVHSDATKPTGFALTRRPALTPHPLAKLHDSE